MTWLTLSLLLGVPTAQAQDELVEAGLSETELERFREGSAALSEERYQDAQGQFWRVHLTNRGHPQTLLGLGQAYRGDDKLKEALQWFDECAHLLDDCAFSAGEVALEIGNVEEAVDRLERLSGEQSPDVQRRVHWALMRAYVAQGEVLPALQEARSAVENQEGDSEWIWTEKELDALLELSGMVRVAAGSERPWEASEDSVWPDLLDVLQSAVTQAEEVEGVDSLETVRFDVEVEEAARRRFGGIDQALDGAQQELARAARQALSTQSWGEAEQLLLSLAADGSRSSEYWGLTGRLLIEREDAADWEEAERALRMANKLAPSNQEWGALLVGLLTDGYGGRRDSEALPVLVDLVAQNPTPELTMELGELASKLGEYNAALRSYLSVVERWPDSPLVGSAKRRVAALERNLPGTRVVQVQPEGLEETVQKGAQWHYHLSVVLQGRGQKERAIEQARLSVDLQPNWPVAMNHLAGLLVEDAPRDALALWQESLDQAPDQVRIRVLRVDALLRIGQPSAALGELEALVNTAPEYHFRRADILESQGQRDAALRALNDYFSTYAGFLFRTEAQSLRSAIAPNERNRSWGLFAVLGMAGLVSAAGFWQWRRRRTGMSLAAFLDREPRSYHDLARVLAGMRHEVLKHNTTLLPTVADALERGDRGPALDASGILLGGQGASGVIDLWERYIGELEAIGLSHGVRLNLRYIDPQIAPMCAAFESLRQLAPKLHKGKPEMMVETIREISKAVNEVGYRELGKLLHEVCVLEVDRSLLDEIWRRVAREPGIVGEGVPTPILEAGDGLNVRVFREDFADILANLLRNACEAAMADRSGPEVRVGVRVVEEMDPITGLSWVAVRVLDNAVSELSNEMIQNRRIGRGIGLALDLAKRSQGSLVVEPEVGWSKAVVLRLGMAEEAEG